MWFDVSGRGGVDSQNMSPSGFLVKSQPSTPGWTGTLKSSQGALLVLPRQTVGQRQRTGEGGFFSWKNYLLGKKKSDDVCGRKSSQEGPVSHITSPLSEAWTFYCLRGLQAPARVAVACLWEAW